MSSIRIESTTCSSTTSLSTTTRRELHPIEKVSRERWVEAIRRLKEGHTYRGQGSPAAKITELGCIVPRKAANRKEHGYIQVEPSKWKPEHGKEPQISPQLAHRVVAYLKACSRAEAESLLYGGYQASHLCGTERCINEEHLEIEDKDTNEARKKCSSSVEIVTTIGTALYLLKAAPCPHGLKQCIRRRERRTAELLEEQKEFLE